MYPVVNDIFYLRHKNGDYSFGQGHFYRTFLAKEINLPPTTMFRI